MPLAQDMVATAQGDECLNALVWRILGRGSGSVELVLEANPGLATLADALPEGTPVTIPATADRSEAARSAPVQLWD